MPADSTAGVLQRTVSGDRDFPRPDAVAVSELCADVAAAGELLPMTGPISAFAFLNTLQALEHLPFDEGLQKGAELYGCEAYLSEERFREKLARGRIRREDLIAMLRKDLGPRADESVAGLCTRLELQLALLENTILDGPVVELRWFVGETDALRKLRSDMPAVLRTKFLNETRHWILRDVRPGNSAHGPSLLREMRGAQAFQDVLAQFGESSIESWSDSTWEAFALQMLWRICSCGVSQEGIGPMASPRDSMRHRDFLYAATWHDSDPLVHSILIRFCAAFTDQGLARWQLPHREQGFWQAFLQFYKSPVGHPEPWLRSLPAEVARLEACGLGPVESIFESLEDLGVSCSERKEFIARTLLALRGWAGLLHHMEVRGDRVAVAVLPGTLLEFLAVRLVLERLALRYLSACSLNYHGPLAGLRDLKARRAGNGRSADGERRAFLVFQLAQALGWFPSRLDQVPAAAWPALITEVEAFGSMERRRTFHAAFERSLRVQALDALSTHACRPVTPPATPRFQSVFCLDAREESFRRHLEECAPDCETFGAAGFFGVAMYYRGIADAHYVASCPIVVRPKHWVVEESVYTLEETHRQRAKARRALGTATHQVHVGSRGIALGALLALGLGVLATIPLVARVLFPRWTARLRRRAGALVKPPPITRLRLERTAATPGQTDEEIGFSVDEMADIGERALRDIGLTSRFARLVMFLGHGSFCLNNPHKSAYDCGACTGSPGGPNGRAIAAILNDIRVRKKLATHDLVIPEETVFLGGLHNTAEDNVTFFDLDLLPKSHYRDFEEARKTLEQACARNAQERCRRFYSAPLNISPADAIRHVEGRAEDLAQTRPEFGNASNALCVVGRRDRTKGLFMDRRCFMMSYDATQDDEESTILLRILNAVVPVCEGINMQYFLSYVDSTGWACGTKLPHNVTSLLGVMDGAESDLRPGLPWQGVEIHEPLRCLFIIETTPRAMLSIMERNAAVGKILKNGWAQLAVLDPHSSRIQVFRQGAFHPYEAESSVLETAASSAEWFRGWREHLPFAQIGS